MKTIASSRADAAPILEIDFARYGEGEMMLAWLDASWTSGRATDPSIADLIDTMIGSIASGLTGQDLGPGPFRVVLNTGAEVLEALVCERVGQVLPDPSPLRLESMRAFHPGQQEPTHRMASGEAGSDS